MYILDIEGKDNLKSLATFWDFRTIKYTALTLKTYNS